MTDQTQSYSEADKVICPSCATSFKAIPENVQAEISSQAEQIRKMEDKIAEYCEHVDLCNSALRKFADDDTKQKKTISALEARIADSVTLIDLNGNVAYLPRTELDSVKNTFVSLEMLNQRELELLAIIEQMREELRYINEVSCGDCELVDVQDDTEAMAYINEHISEFLDKENVIHLSALKEHDARVLEEAAGLLDCHSVFLYPAEVVFEIRRMASELRQP